MRMNDYRTPRRASAKTAHTAGKELWQERSKPVLANGSQHTTAITPYYDSERRELRVGTIVLKCFTQGSDAQEIILASFQEENWCHSIDDPLTGKDGQDAKQRLRTAVVEFPTKSGHGVKG